MKTRIFLLFIFLWGGSVMAQEVGIRFGGVSGGGGAAVDLVFGTGPNRIHADVGFFNDAIGADVLWDVLYRPLGSEAFYWYIGVGPSALIGDIFRLGVAGELGLEYRFVEVPIVLGLDWRPTFWILDETAFGPDSFGLNVRWNFGG